MGERTPADQIYLDIFKVWMPNWFNLIEYPNWISKIFENVSTEFFHFTHCKAGSHWSPVNAVRQKENHWNPYWNPMKPSGTHRNRRNKPNSRNLTAQSSNQVKTSGHQPEVPGNPLCGTVVELKFLLMLSHTGSVCLPSGMPAKWPAF